MTTNRFKAQELCSRKLWELVNTPGQQQEINEAELREAIHELAERRHYLAELTETGILGSSN
jgi:hypothetical protein